MIWLNNIYLNLTLLGAKMSRIGNVVQDGNKYFDVSNEMKKVFYD